eukprot:CAMPEP_0197864128 /NCGR_PEP_ID=MMETSP1438-20131217/42114_1 /TAXON_ID=1461541 /ORGANISM="Pterosperma sp., Strain CCMP1384" /LENGTH=154 /DNA_ID=CAMNT_0043482255 /DNA_START=37 /DNA_END=498 /DNA_ORIENTATION=+
MEESSEVKEVEMTEQPTAPDADQADGAAKGDPSSLTDVLQEDADTVLEDDLEGEANTAPEAGGDGEDGGAEEDEEDEAEKGPTTLVPKPTKRAEVFLGGLEKKACEEDVRNVFSAVGEVLEVRIMKKEGEDSVGKGYGFVLYATQEEAKKAVTD